MEELQRPGSSRSVRPGKFTQTFSRFKGIIRIPGRKPTSHAQKSPTHHENRGRPGLANAMHPYPKATPPTLRESMSLKPYMSQPMLALQRTSMDTDPHSQPSDPDSEASSSSPDPSPCRMHSEFPLPTKKQNDDTRRRSRRMSTHSLTSPPTEEFGTRPETTYYDTISGPWDSISTSIKDVHDNEPTPPTPPPKPVRKNLQNAQNPPRRAPLPAPPPLGSSSPPRTTTSPGPRPLPPRRPLPPVPQEPPTTALTTSPDTTNTHLEARSSIHLPTAVTSPAVPTRNSLSESLAATPKPEPMPVRFASEADGEALDIILNPSARRPAPPKLNLPTSLSRRISLLQAAGGVRLSPTIMARPPPLPIMNLPRLPVPASGDVLGEGAGVSRRRSERVGLGSMPALPLQGTTRGAGGHEEMDDMEEDDEEEEEETDDVETDEESEPRTSFTSTDSGSARSDEGILSRGSYDVPRPELPPLALASPFDIRFQHSGEASSSSSWSSGMIAGDGSVDKKGKSKLVVPSPLSSGSSAITASSDESSALSSSSSSDMGGEFSRILRPSLSVTTSTNSSYYSFASGGEDAGEYFDGRLAKAISQSRSDATDRTPLAAPRADPFNKTNPSPLATPRALSQFEMPKAIAVLQGANDGKSNNRNSLAFVGGGGGGINSRPASVLVQRPTMHKRASRSLVDLQAAAKRQEVEQIVREEEEEQEREQRRRRSMRRSVVVGSSNGGDDSLDGYRASMHLHHLRNEGLGPMAEEETLPNRVEGEDAGSAIRSRITRASIATKEAAYSQDGPRNGVPGSEDPNNAGTGGSSMAGSSSAGAAGSNVMNPSTTTTWKDATGAPGVLEGRQHQKNNRISMAPAYEASLNPLPPLRRRRSMPTYNETTAPPPYPSFAPHPYGLHASLKVLPREDEGREVLPGYSNAIFLKAIMPLKMEFSAPGVQAKDRKWKRVLVVLEGTMLKVYRAPTGPGGVSAIEQWWENKVGAGDVALGPPPAVPAAGSAGTGRAAIAVPAKKEERNREEEKVNQQYLQATVHDELRVDEGQGSSWAAASTASLAGSVAAQRHGKEHHHHQPQATQVAITKSALNLAVHLLKPGSRHIRSNSDTGPPSPTAAFRTPDGIPRSSLNLPRPGTNTPTSSTFSSSSRSHSPMPSSSSSVTPHGSRSHSPMPSGSSLAVPSSSSSFSSRPPTPTSAGSSRSSRLRTTNTGSRTAYGRACKSEDFEPPKQDLIRCYTMQNAESGLGNDYLKRKNVIRVRLEGEQFLLQAKDVSSVVQWIEGLQAATNIALDLDDRPMPRGPIFPRRRRRRRPNVTPILVNGQAPLATSAVMETYTPTSATAGQPVFRRT